MRLFTPLRPSPNALLARANPVAKLAAALLLMTVLFVSVDPVTPAVILTGLAGSVWLSGSPGPPCWPGPGRSCSPRWWWRWNALFGPAGAGELFRIGPLA